VLVGYLLMSNDGSSSSRVNCLFAVDDAIPFQAGFGRVPPGLESGQVTLVGWTFVKAGAHTIHVTCAALDSPDVKDTRTPLARAVAKAGRPSVKAEGGCAGLGHGRTVARALDCHWWWKV
jgi:hypothetical protein